MKISVAGLSAVLPSQNAIAAPGAACRARSPATTGAAQQVHIMPGNDIRPPFTTLLKSLRPSARATHCGGISACTAEPSNRPSTIACQMALP
jgi:hypothetical protein